MISKCRYMNTKFICEMLKYHNIVICMKFKLQRGFCNNCWSKQWPNTSASMETLILYCIPSTYFLKICKTKWIHLSPFRCLFEKACLYLGLLDKQRRLFLSYVKSNLHVFNMIITWHCTSPPTTLFEEGIWCPKSGK